MKDKQIQNKFFEALISFNSLIFFDLTFKNHRQNMKYAEVKKDITFAKEYDHFFFAVGPTVRVILMLNKTRLGKKRTAMQKKTLNPVYNEAFTFKVTSEALPKVTFKVLVVNKHSHGAEQTVGHVLLGQQVTGSGFSHWNHMLASLRKPIAMWHPIIPGA